MIKGYWEECKPFNAELVAISKTKPLEDILEAFEFGQRHFGENKVQELVEKQPKLPEEIKWHFVGHLQTNKVKYLAPFVHLIHGVDSLKVLKEINKQALKSNRIIPVLLQMHIAKESTKFGLNETELDDILRSDQLSEYKNISIEGLMGMATFTNDEKIVDSEFSYLHSQFERIKREYEMDNLRMKHLSMGMTNDYKIALRNGATLIRIGSAIFGARN